MGFLFSSPKPQQPNPKAALQSQIQSHDVIKVKLKHVRDRLNKYINLKNQEEESVNQKIKELVPEYERTGSKKKMAPYLSTKLSIKKNIQSAQLQLKVILDQLSEVEMAQINKDTVDALQQANKYTDQIMKELQAKDWQGILMESQKKYQIDWPKEDEELQDDPIFQEMWKEMGGAELDKQAKPQKANKIVQAKKVHVEIPAQTNTNQKQLQQQTA